MAQRLRATAVARGERGQCETRVLVAVVAVEHRQVAALGEPRVVEGDGSGPRIVALDTGIKTSIVRHFAARGATLELLPCTTPAAEVLARGADGLFLVPGPGDPATLGYLVDTVR